MDLVYPPVLGAGRLLFRALGLRATLEGDEHVPGTGPVLLAANHVSFLDFLLVGLAARRGDRLVRVLARHDVWHHPLAGPLMRGMGHVPVDRQAPAAAYLRARSLLRQGEAVGIFPEAGVSTSYTVRPLMPGTVALAAETGVPVLPVALWGPQRILTVGRRLDPTRGRPVSVAVGPPLHFPAGTDVVAGTRDLGRTLQRMLDGLQARPEHQPASGETAPWHPAHLGGQAPSVAQARAVEVLPGTAVPPGAGRTTPKM